LVAADLVDAKLEPIVLSRAVDHVKTPGNFVSYDEEYALGAGSGTHETVEFVLGYVDFRRFVAVDQGAVSKLALVVAAIGFNRAVLVTKVGRFAAGHDLDHPPVNI
jgi:hypothetical protein